MPKTIVARRRAALHPRPSPVGAYEMALVAGLLVLVTTVMWLRHGGLDQLDRPAGWVIAVGQVSSLYATLAVLAMMLLVARVPWIERTVGLDLANHWHRSAAIASAVLIAVHVVASTLGYALDAQVGVLGQYGEFLASWPDMLTATIGTVMFFGVGLTSARLARRMMRYEIWWLIHLVGYVAVLLSFFHELSTGFDFFDDPLATLFWVGLHLAVLAAFVVYRVAAPFVGEARHRLRIAEVRAESADTVTITLRGRHLDRMRVAGGQFFLLRFLVRGRWWKAHPYSLSAAPDGESLRFTIKARGDDSAAVLGYPVGTRVVAEGPYGHLTAESATRRDVALIGGGIGITPIRAILEGLDRPPGFVRVLFRARTRAEAPLLDELTALAEANGHQVVVSYSQEPGQAEALVFTPDRLREVFPRLVQSDVFLCGPITNDAVAGLREAGVPRRQIHFERFSY